MARVFLIKLQEKNIRDSNVLSLGHFDNNKKLYLKTHNSRTVMHLAQIHCIQPGLKRAKKKAKRSGE
jgi:hypothetical protein